MNAKQYLKKAKRISSFIKAKEEELQMLRAKATAIKSQDVSVERIQSSPVLDKLGNNVANIDECERKIIKAINDLKKLHIEITDKINEIAHDDYRLILTLRYLNIKEWSYIADEMCYSISHIKLLHSKALNAFEEQHKDFLCGYVKTK